MRPLNPALAIAFILVFMPYPVLADEVRGFVANVGLGLSQISDDDDDGSFDGDAVGWTVDFEYRVSRYIALGIGLFDLGEASDDVGGVPTTIDAGGIDFFVRGIWPANDKVDIYGRLGSAAYSAAIRPDLGLAFFEDGLLLGLGLDARIADSWSVRFEARTIRGDNDESASLVTAGLSYRF